MDGYNYMDNSNAYVNNDIYGELIEQQSESTRESIKFSNELIKSYQNMIKKFEGVDEVSDTWKTIQKLNEEVTRLKDSTKSLNKSISDNNEMIKRKPQDIKDRRVLTEEEMEALPARHRKMKLQRDEKAREDDATFKESANSKLNANDDLLSKVNDNLTASSFTMKKFQHEYESLRKSKEKEDDQKPNEGEKPKSDEPKSKPTDVEGKGDQEVEKKKDDRLKKFGLFFVKASAKTTANTFKAVLSPVTMLLKGIGGMLSGIWNSSLMGIAKVVALIGVLVLAFDWVKVTIAGWRKEMVENFDAFLGENGVWGETMANIVALSDAIGNWSNGDVDSALLNSTVSKFETIIDPFMEVLKSTFKSLINELYDFIGLKVHNALPWNNEMTEDGYQREKILNTWDTDDTDVNMLNAGNKKARDKVINQQHASGLFSTFKTIYGSDGRTEDMKFDELSSSFFNDEKGKISKSIVPLLMTDRNISREEAVELSKNEDIMRGYYDKMFLVMKDLEEEGINFGNMENFLPYLMEHKLPRASSVGDPTVSNSIVNKTLESFEKRGLTNPDMIDKRIDDLVVANGNNHPNLNYFNSLKNEGLNLKNIDNEGISMNRSLSSVSRDDGLSNILKDIGVKIDNMNNNQSIISNSANIQNNNTYTGQTPSGNVGVFGYGSVNFGSDK